MTKKSIFSFMLVYASATFSMEKESTAHLTGLLSELIVESPANLAHLAKNLINYDELAKALLEISVKLDNQSAEDIKSEEVLFYYLIEENLRLGKEDLQAIVNDGEQNFLSSYSPEIKKYFDFAYSFIKSQTKNVDELNNIIDIDNLIKKIISSLHYPLIRFFFNLGLIDIEKHTKCVYLGFFETFNSKLAQNVSTELHQLIAKPIIENIFQQSPLDYIGLLKHLDSAKQIMSQETFSNLHAYLIKLQRYKNLRDNYAQFNT